VFLAVVAILIGAPALFYITTGLIATIGACHLQSYLAVRWLRLERLAPDTVRVGDLVTIETMCWSEKKIRRPLVAVIDHLPPRLTGGSVTPSLPIAPAYDIPIRSQYQFRPQKRGRYRWTGLTVMGADALGLITKRKDYPTETAEMVVLPAPIPVSIELPSAMGWGLSEAESGHNRGAGIEPWGIRDYAPGDSLRAIHWRSTAKTGRLLVKEFEAGSHAKAAFVLQRTKGSDVGAGPMTSLDVMCGHALFITDAMLRQGAQVSFLGIDEGTGYASHHERLAEVALSLAGVMADSSETLAEQVGKASQELSPGSILFLMQAVVDENLPDAVKQLAARGIQTVALLYDPFALAAEHDHRAPANRTRVREARRAEFAAANLLNVERLRAAGAVPIIMPVEIGHA
jgi:uncharacterized protein (DUF58 family)